MKTNTPNRLVGVPHPKQAACPSCHRTLVRPKASLIGRTVINVRPMSRIECEAEGWREHGTAIEFDDGAVLYASRDAEGNGPGVLFGRFPNGLQVALIAS